MLSCLWDGTRKESLLLIVESNLCSVKHGGYVDGKIK